MKNGDDRRMKLYFDDGGMNFFKQCSKLQNACCAEENGRKRLLELRFIDRLINRGVERIAID